MENQYKKMTLENVAYTIYNMYDYDELVKLLSMDEEDVEAELDIILDKIQDDDTVTGNESGSYTYNGNEAKEIFENSIDGRDLLIELVDNDTYFKFQIADDFLNENYEDLDVLARLSAIGFVRDNLDEVKQRLEDYLHNN